MKAADLIERLQKARDKYGDDLDVYVRVAPERKDAMVLLPAKATLYEWVDVWAYGPHRGEERRAIVYFEWEGE